jgi:hypothetical protein
VHVAFDAAPVTLDNNDTNPYHFSHVWTHVEQGGPDELVKYKDHALFLCWPDYDSSFASDCLVHYKGDTVIYVGEGFGGCTANDEFHSTLSDAWTRLETVRIPQWDGIHDKLWVYRRGADDRDESDMDGV